MSDLYSVNDGKLSVTLHAGQTRAWDSTKRMVFIVAGTQGGKTSMTPIWLHREIKERGDGDYLAVTATYDLFKLKFLPEMRRYFEMFGWEYSASERILFHEYKPRMFSRIILRSANAPGGLESATAKAAVLDECGQDDFRIDSWEAVQRRLSLARGRVLGATTPYNMGWLKTEIYDRWVGGDPDIQVVQFKSIMNPVFPKDEYYRAKRTMQPWKFSMFYDGEFTRPAGLIYDVFDKSYDTCPRFAIPVKWPRFLGLDFGGIHTAAMFYAQSPDGKLYAYREYLAGGKTAAEHAKDLLKDEPGRPLCVGGSKSEGQWRKEFAAGGLAVRAPEISDVEVGIDRVYEANKAHDIIYFDDLRGFIEQKQMYSRKVDESGEPTEEIKDKDTFHFMDAERYIIGYLRRKTSKAQSEKINLYSKPHEKYTHLPARDDNEVADMLKESNYV